VGGALGVRRARLRGEIMAKGILLNSRNHARVPQDEYDDWYET
jgi:hypothetical protein